MTNKVKPSKLQMARIIYAGFFLVFIIFMLVTMIIPHGMIKVFGSSYYRVTSPSMAPTLNVGDYVVVTRTNVNDLGMGDIIIFSTKRELGTSEIVERVNVIHYFGYIDEEEHIYTYNEANKNLAFDDLDKYDKWGTETRPYYVTKEDLIGKHKETIKKDSVMVYPYLLFYSPLFYIGIGILLTGGLSAIDWLNRPTSGKKSPTL